MFKFITMRNRLGCRVILFVYCYVCTEKTGVWTSTSKSLCSLLQWKNVDQKTPYIFVVLQIVKHS